MKNKFKLFGIVAVSAIIGFAFLGCEGPTGPQGPQGYPGYDGYEGPQGPVGPARPDATGIDISTCGRGGFNLEVGPATGYMYLDMYLDFPLTLTATVSPGDYVVSRTVIWETADSDVIEIRRVMSPRHALLSGGAVTVRFLRDHDERYYTGSGYIGETARIFATAIGGGEDGVIADILVRRVAPTLTRNVVVTRESTVAPLDDGSFAFLGSDAITMRPGMNTRLYATVLGSDGRRYGWDRPYYIGVDGRFDTSVTVDRQPTFIWGINYDGTGNPVAGVEVEGGVDDTGDFDVHYGIVRVADNAALGTWGITARGVCTEPAGQAQGVTIGSTNLTVTEVATVTIGEQDVYFVADITLNQTATFEVRAYNIGGTSHPISGNVTGLPSGMSAAGTVTVSNGIGTGTMTVTSTDRQFVRVSTASLDIAGQSIPFSVHVVEAVVTIEASDIVDVSGGDQIAFANINTSSQVLTATMEPNIPGVTWSWDVSGGNASPAGASGNTVNLTAGTVTGRIRVLARTGADGAISGEIYVYIIGEPALELDYEATSGDYMYVTVTVENMMSIGDTNISFTSANVDVATTGALISNRGQGYGFIIVNERGEGTGILRLNTASASGTVTVTLGGVSQSITIP